MPEKDDKPANRPLRLESVDNDEKYRIFQEKGIASILRSMKHHNTLATCYFDDSDDFMLTTIRPVHLGRIPPESNRKCGHSLLLAARTDGCFRRIKVGYYGRHRKFFCVIHGRQPATGQPARKSQ